MRRFRQRIRLGDLLIEYGMITDEQLQHALVFQKENGIKIGQALIQLGYVTKRNIHEVLEQQLGIPYVKLSEYDIEEKATKTITEQIAKKHVLIPVKQTETEVYVAMSDPLNIFALDDVKIYSGKEVVPLLSEELDVLRSIDMYYGQQKVMRAAEEYKQERLIDLNEEITENDIEDDLVKSAPIVKLVNTVLEQSVRYRASDIHIEPYEKKIRVRYRVDGALQNMYEYEPYLLSAIVARIKITSGMDIAEKRKPQDGRLTIVVDRSEYDVRVSSLPTVYGEKVVMRVNSKEGFNKGKAQLGFFDDDLEKFDGILSNPHGIILVTGPTGSGKSTTLYTALNEINDEFLNIVTVEDPVESQIEGINQVHVNPKAGLTFASALRSILRQDPDVIMIGEIRDKETAEIAVKASITGHLVVSTLHTNDAPSTITRLVDMGVEPFMIGASVVGVIAQRLVRKLCPHCKRRKEATENEKKILGVDSNESLQIYEPVGCHVCNDSGYSGRIGIYEIMIVDHEVRHVINNEGNTDDIRKTALDSGMKNLRTNGIRRVLDGTTTVEELVRVAYGND